MLDGGRDMHDTHKHPQARYGSGNTDVTAYFTALVILHKRALQGGRLQQALHRFERLPITH